MKNNSTDRGDFTSEDLITAMGDDFRLLTSEQAASILGVRIQTLRSWSYQKKNLPIVKIGGRVRYRLSDLKRFIESRTIQPSNGQERIAPQKKTYRMRKETREILRKHGLLPKE
jgi:excisionase family DNA binding protein